jgi:hypothetical protein
VRRKDVESMVASGYQIKRNADRRVHFLLRKRKFVKFFDILGNNKL